MPLYYLFCVLLEQLIKCIIIASSGLTNQHFRICTMAFGLARIKYTYCPGEQSLRLWYNTIISYTYCWRRLAWQSCPLWWGWRWPAWHRRRAPWRDFLSPGLQRTWPPRDGHLKIRQKRFKKAKNNKKATLKWQDMNQFINLTKLL